MGQYIHVTGEILKSVPIVIIPCLHKEIQQNNKSNVCWRYQVKRLFYVAYVDEGSCRIEVKINEEIKEIIVIMFSKLRTTNISVRK